MLSPLVTFHLKRLHPLAAFNAPPPLHLFDRRHFGALCRSVIVTSQGITVQAWKQCRWTVRCYMLSWRRYYLQLTNIWWVSLMVGEGEGRDWEVRGRRRNGKSLLFTQLVCSMVLCKNSGKQPSTLHLCVIKQTFKVNFFYLAIVKTVSYLAGRPVVWVDQISLQTTKVTSGFRPTELFISTSMVLHCPPSLWRIKQP